MADERLAIIGFGKMGEALARGVLRAGVYKREALAACDPDPERIKVAREELGIATFTTNADAVGVADIVLLAVKPQIIREVLSGIAYAGGADKLFVSIAAGVAIETIEGLLGKDSRVIRVMPNTPCLVGAGASAFAMGTNADAEDGEKVQAIFSAVGRCVKVDEKLLDAVTALSGSGPAYVFVFIEALADGGVRMGLPRSTAMELAVQTVLGAAKLVAETDTHPAKLKDDVTSPGGTTIAALHALEKGGFRAAVIDAIAAAARRSSEIGK